MREKRVPLELNFFKVLVSNQTSGVKKKKDFREMDIAKKIREKKIKIIKSIDSEFES